MYKRQTTTSVVSGITNDLPRLDYSGDASCPSLLLEPSRQNFELHSEYLNAASVKDNVTITSNATTSPEGVVNASSLVDNATSGIHRFYSVPSTTAASGATMTHSIFAKANGHSWFQLSSGGQTNDQWANFDLTNGVIGNSSASANAKIQPMGNDWYRCIINSTTSASSALVATLPTLTNDTDVATRSPSYIGSGNGVFVYGLQCELGSYPTSLIPCYGTSATRTADDCYRNPQALLGATTGSWFADIQDFRFQITGTTSPSVYIGYNTSNYLGLAARVAGNDSDLIFAKRESGTTNNLYTEVAPSGATKFCFTWSGTSLKLFVNGSKVYDDNSFAGFITWDDFELNEGSRAANYRMNQTLLFPTQISDADAIALTA